MSEVLTNAYQFQNEKKKPFNKIVSLFSRKIACYITSDVAKLCNNDIFFFVYYDNEARKLEYQVHHLCDIIALITPQLNENITCPITSDVTK